MEGLAMEVVLEVCVFLAFCLGFYVWNQRKIFVKYLQGDKEPQLNNQEAINKQKQILANVENFLSSSEYIEPIGKLNNNIIYKFIKNNQSIYQFEDVMAENNQKVGIDDNFLCFKRLSYKRISHI